jgi:GntR family transcriptional regulator
MISTPPLYMQIRDTLAERIQSGELPPDTRISSERDLSREYSVSRMTVRQAITDLVNLGILTRRRGDGTYVTQPKVTQTLNQLIGFTELMERRRVLPGAKVLELTVIGANKALARHLQINVGDRIWRIVRVRTGDRQPLALEHSFFPARLCPNLGRFDLEQRSIYRILKDEYGLVLTRATQTLEPTVANDFEAAALEVPKGSPLMLLERVGFAGDGVAVEYAKDLYRGDRSRFVVEMTMGDEDADYGRSAQR